MRYLGLDLGTKTLGISISDKTGLIASPYKTINYDDQETLLNETKDIIETEKIEKIILGLPLNMNNTEGESVRRTKEFKEKLETLINVPIDFQDERLSTSAAERVLIDADLSRKKRKKVIDKLAAVVILQNYLDKENM